MNYYNDNDPKAAEWLRELIRGGHIPRGDVDDRSIIDLQAGDLDGYTQCHFFAGISGWSLALQLAGWPEGQRVWTGSCPCQPFSCAGKRKGEKDKRHLWPELRRLIAECRPSTVFGEQVASKDGRIWLSGVRSDLEALGYAVGASDLCAAGVGAPHIRQRLFWVADPHMSSMHERPSGWQQQIYHKMCESFRLGNPQRPEWRTINSACGDHRINSISQLEESPNRTGGTGEVCCMEHAGHCAGCSVCRLERYTDGSGSRQPGAWDNFDFVHCTDGKSRRIEAGTFPLAHGIPSRMGLLRGYGNAIVPQVAAEFIMAYMEV